MLCECVMPCTGRVVLRFLKTGFSSSESAKGASVKVKSVVVLVHGCRELFGDSRLLIAPRLLPKRHIQPTSATPRQTSHGFNTKPQNLTNW